MKKLFLLAAVVMILAGCALANKPTPEQIAAADYGNYPDNYQEIIINYMLDRFYDPNPVYKGWTPPVKAHAYDMNGAYYGYKTCVEANPKNRMGGYTGFKLYRFLIKNGGVVFFDSSGQGGCY